MVVGRERDLLGAISFGDELREDAGAAVAAMEEAGVVPVLVTGDNEGAARRVAAALGIEEVAMAASVTTIFVNALWGRPSLFFDAVLSVGRGSGAAPAAAGSARS